jgi:hypothetical protein
MDPQALATPRTGPLAKPGPWVDLGLTLPIFLVYQLGVVFLDVRNGTDLVTGELLRLADGSRGLYLLFTAAIGVVFTGVFAWLGRGQTFTAGKFIQIAAEGALYALLMRLTGAYVVGRIFAEASGGLRTAGPFVGLIMSFGAGFYEELAFRVVLFGLGAKVALYIATRERIGLERDPGLRLSAQGFFVMLAWAVAAAAIFSGVHYVGALGDSFDLVTFTFRFVLGLSLTLIYALRGFAAAVWTHALYDVWVLVG